MHKIIASRPTFHQLPLHRMVSVDVIPETGFEMDQKSYDNAIRNGFFQVKMPSALKAHIATLDAFVNKFYENKKNDGSKEDAYRGFNKQFNDANPNLLNPLQGYIVDNNKADAKRQNQVERFSLVNSPTHPNWSFFPPEVKAAAESMNQLGIDVLKFVLKKLGVSDNFLAAASGGAAINQGDHFNLYNHFDPSEKIRGLKEHKDWSNVTVLRSTQPGLCAQIGGDWQRVQATSPDYLVINFGTTLEILTQHLPENERVVASNHLVTQQQTDRVSYTIFLDHGITTPIYELHDMGPDRRLVMHKHYPTFLAYAIEMSAKSYEGAGAGDEIV